MYQMLHHAASVVGRVCTLGCCLSHQTELPHIYVTVHENATSFLKAVGPWLQTEEELANPILSHAETLSMLECRPSSMSQNNPASSTIWVSSWSLPPSPPTSELENTTTPSAQVTHSPSVTPRLDFVAMVSACHLGPMPVFLFAPSNSDIALEDNANLMVGMRSTVMQIAEAVPPERVCSTFGRAPLSNAFAAAWEEHSGYGRIPIPWKRARMFLCLPRTLAATAHNAPEESATVRVREVIEDDIPILADFCHRFSIDNSPSPLTLEECTAHAYHLVATHQAWVCETVPHGSESDSSRIVSFCEVSRRTKNTAAISKIFTLPPHRGNGYATRLLRDVSRLLFATGASSVVSFALGPELFANCIFLGSGFGLYDQTEWIEWGFNGAGLSYW